jgi:FkbM family methyltransferase
MDHYIGFHTVDMFDCPPFMMFTVDDSPASHYIMIEKRFEPMSMKVWAALARTATGILDIGANVGVYALVAASLRNDISVHAFEPNPYAFARLRLHRSLNAFSHVKIHTVALSNKRGIERLSWAVKDRNNISSGGTLVRDSYEGCETVPCDVAPLDDFAHIRVGTRGLVKIDVEGAEHAVILGMKKVLMEKPDIIIEALNSNVCRDINKTVMPLGYRSYFIDETAMTLRETDGLAAGSIPDKNMNSLLTAHPLPPHLASCIVT